MDLHLSGRCSHQNLDSVEETANLAAWYHSLWTFCIYKTIGPNLETLHSLLPSLHMFPSVNQFERIYSESLRRLYISSLRSILGE
jgi:hypothetical protein